MDTWVASTFWLLWIMLLAVNVGIQVSVQVPAFIYFGCIPKRLLADMVILFLTFWGTAKLFPKQLHHFTFPPVTREGSLCVFQFNRIFILYHCIVDLQCCVSFRCRAKSFIYTYTYIHSFSDFSPCRLLQHIEQSSLCYTVGPCWLFIHSSVYMLIPNA